MIILFLVTIGYILNILAIKSLVELGYSPYKRIRLFASLSVLISYFTLIIRMVYAICNIYLDLEQWIKRGLL